MGDLREENARLKEQLQRVQQVCALHRKMGEDTEFEVRELKRRAALTKSEFIQFLQHYEALTTSVATAGSEEMRGLLELCEAALRRVERLVAAL
jgi:hypothetical protein